MEESGSFLKTAFMAVASCFVVHLGFTYFGVEEWFHDLGPGFGGPAE